MRMIGRQKEESFGLLIIILTQIELLAQNTLGPEIVKS